MIRFITALEAEKLEETLMDAFRLAKEAEDFELQIDINAAYIMISQLRRGTAEQALDAG